MVFVISEFKYTGTVISLITHCLSKAKEMEALPFQARFSRLKLKDIIKSKSAARTSRNGKNSCCIFDTTFFYSQRAKRLDKNTIHNSTVLH